MSPVRSASPAGPRARVRVYRHGLGDCILVQLRLPNGADYKVLIDCGVAVATQDAPAKMAGVVKDVIAATDGRIDVLAVTHEHWDHVSGFTQAAEAFEGLAVGEVWVAWTEDERDPLARELRGERDGALRALTRATRHLCAHGDPGAALGITNVVGLFGAAGERSKAAFDNAKDKAKDKGGVRYCRPADAPIEVAGARIYVLGPPADAKLIRKTLPSKRHPETFELALDGRGVLPAGIASALIEDLEGASAPPFAETMTIPIEAARGMTFFQNHYWGLPGGDTDWRRIDGDWLGPADDLALALQSATNNTSLVLAIELDGGDVLLFAGDAQVGNWLSWQDCKWKVGGAEVTGPDLLARTVFYKVGHHGSHNATLREKGLDMMKALRTAVIPVDREVALKMRWSAMPLTSLLEALDTATCGRALRTDLAPAASHPDITVEDLYYEIAI